MIDRFEGTLLGLAVGDALGGPFEGRPRAAATRAGLDRVAQNPLTSDDTAMTILLAESLISERGFSADDLASRFAHWALTDGRGIGRSSYYALRLVGEGTPWREAGRRAHEMARGLSAGNGPLMRSAPLALACHRDPDRLIASTLESARITHWDDRAGLGAAALNLMLSAIVHGERDNASIATLRSSSLRSTIVLDAPSPLRQRSPELDSLLSRLPAMRYEDLTPSGYVFDTLASSAWCFLNGDDFESVILRAVSLGGDADTISAVAGALSGCYYTSSAIPQNWLAALAECAKLKELARGLLRLSSEHGNPAS